MHRGSGPSIGGEWGLPGRNNRGLSFSFLSSGDITSFTRIPTPISLFVMQFVARESGFVPVFFWRANRIPCNVWNQGETFRGENRAIQKEEIRKESNEVQGSKEDIGCGGADGDDGIIAHRSSG